MARNNLVAGAQNIQVINRGFFYLLDLHINISLLKYLGNSEEILDAESYVTCFLPALLIYDPISLFFQYTLYLLIKRTVPQAFVEFSVSSVGYFFSCIFIYVCLVCIRTAAGTKI